MCVCSLFFLLRFACVGLCDAINEKFEKKILLASFINCSARYSLYLILDEITWENRKMMCVTEKIFL